MDMIASFYNASNEAMLEDMELDRKIDNRFRQLYEAQALAKLPII